MVGSINKTKLIKHHLIQKEDREMIVSGYDYVQKCPSFIDRDYLLVYQAIIFLESKMVLF